MYFYDCSLPSLKSFTEDSEDEDTNSVSENDSTQAEPDHSIIHEDAWVGMGHVLAISRKERRASGPPCVPAGEYSKVAIKSHTV